jgi:predicted DNA-binding protein with PD1-like motif
LIRQRRKNVEGDLDKSARREGVRWKPELHTVFLSEKKPIMFETIPRGNSFVNDLKMLLERSGLSQGYVTCDRGVVSNIRCGFFMTRHEPFATFAEKLFRGRNRVISMSGFFLEIASNVVPHLHITLENARTGKLMGGHVIDAESGRMECKVVPISNPALTRETDPSSGVMHIRSLGTRGRGYSIGKTMAFACAPGEIFPNNLLEKISRFGARRATVRFAVGTLLWASLSDGHNSLIKSDGGIELTSMSGVLSFRDDSFSYGLHVHLIDKYGRVFSGNFMCGEVKDLIEGVIQFQ